MRRHSLTIRGNEAERHSLSAHRAAQPRWNGGETFGGEFYGNQPTGKSYELRGCGFFQFKDGKIILQRGYWDKLTWFSQIGLSVK